MRAYGHLCLTTELEVWLCACVCVHVCVHNTGVVEGIHTRTDSKLGSHFGQVAAPSSGFDWRCILTSALVQAGLVSISPRLLLGRPAGAQSGRCGREHAKAATTSTRSSWLREHAQRNFCQSVQNVWTWVTKCACAELLKTYALTFDPLTSSYPGG